jgi:hypothetical protein
MNMASRLHCAEKNQCRAWKRVVLTYMMLIIFKHPGTKVMPVTWLYKGEQREALTANHPDCVNHYADITINGVTKCHLVTSTSKQSTKYSKNDGKVAKNITAT